VAPVPLWLKFGWTAWVALWAPTYALHHGPENFLWFCDLANFAIAAGLWLESPLLLSWQAVSVLVVQILYLVDVAGRYVLGFFPIGATMFIFDEKVPLQIRLVSLFLHAVTPPILLWGVKRLGYDRRALGVQVAAAAAILAISYLGGPDRDINWSHGPFGKPQTVVAPGLYLLVAVVGYTILLYLPAHLFLSRVWPRNSPGTAPRPPEPP
jgi:hypothetical protein